MKLQNQLCRTSMICGEHVIVSENWRAALSLGWNHSKGNTVGLLGRATWRFILSTLLTATSQFRVLIGQEM